MVSIEQDLLKQEVEVNFVTSMYSKETNIYKKWIPKNLLFFDDTKEAVLSARLQSPSSKTAYEEKVAKTIKHVKKLSKKINKLPNDLPAKKGIILKSSLVSDEINSLHSLTDELGIITEEEMPIAKAVLNSVTTTDERGTLIAVHNIKADALSASLDRGGFPMPSLAVIHPDIEHDAYGGISLVMKKDVGNKMVEDRAIYSGDMYSPTFPRIFRGLSEKIRNFIEHMFDGIDSLIHGRFQFNGNLFYDKLLPLMDDIEKYGFAYALNHASYATKVPFYIYYLKQQGKDVSFAKYIGINIESLKRFKERFDFEKGKFEDASMMDSWDQLNAAWSLIEEDNDKVNFFGHEITRQSLESSMESIPKFAEKVWNVVDDALKHETALKEYSDFEDLLANRDNQEYYDFVDFADDEFGEKIVAGLEEQVRYHNHGDWITLPASLDNIYKAMKEGQRYVDYTDQRYYQEFTRPFKDRADLRNAEDNLGYVEKYTYPGRFKDDGVAFNKYRKKFVTSVLKSNPFIEEIGEGDDFKEVFLSDDPENNINIMIAEAVSKEWSFEKAFEKYINKGFRDSIGKEIILTKKQIELGNNLLQTATDRWSGYFEGKYKGILTANDIACAVMSKNLENSAIVVKLQENGIRTEFYDPATGYDARTEAVKRVSDEQTLFSAIEDESLISMHDISEDNLAQALDLGGLVMPSVAVSMPGIDQRFDGSYGEISLIFKRSLGKEMASKREISSGDAQSAIFPHIKYTIDRSSIKHLTDKIGNDIYAENMLKEIESSYLKSWPVKDKAKSWLKESVAIKDDFNRVVKDTLDYNSFIDQLVDGIKVDKQVFSKAKNTWVDATKESILASMQEYETDPNHLSYNEGFVRKFANREDIRKHENRLDGEYEELNYDISNDIENVKKDFVDAILEHNQVDKRRLYKGVDTAIAAAFLNDSTVQEEFEKETEIKLTNDEKVLADKLFKVATDKYTPYFEGKPKRVVSFDEVQTAIMPERLRDSEVSKKLATYGIETKFFEDDEQRMELQQEASNSNTLFSLLDEEFEINESIVPKSVRKHDYVKNPNGTLTVMIDTDEELDLFRDWLALEGINAKGTYDKKNGTLKFAAAHGYRVENFIKGISQFTQNEIRREYEKNPDGTIVGAPERFNTEEKLVELRERLKQLVKEGLIARFWYENSSRLFMLATGGRKTRARILANMAAVFSPATKVSENSRRAIKGYYQILRDEKPRAGMPNQDKAANQVAQGKAFGGQKINNFLYNLLSNIFPVNPKGITNDMWNMRAFGYDHEAPTDAQYSFVINEMLKITEELNNEGFDAQNGEWLPRQVQAAIWTAIMTRWAAAEKANKKLKGINEEKVRINSTYDASMAIDASTLEINGFNFVDAFNAYKGTISQEFTPGPDMGIFPQIMIKDANGENKVNPAYNSFLEKWRKKMRDIFTVTDEDGYTHDIIARPLGLLTDSDIDALGIYEGMFTPGRQLGVYVSYDKSIDNTNIISAAAREHLTDYCAIFGILNAQEAVTYSALTNLANKSKEALVYQNGALLQHPDGSPMTEEDCRRIYEHVKRIMEKVLPKCNVDSLAFVPLPQGLSIFNCAQVYNLEEQYRGPVVDKIYETKKAQAEAEGEEFKLKKEDIEIKGIVPKGYKFDQKLQNEWKTNEWGDVLIYNETFQKIMENLQEEIASESNISYTKCTEDGGYISAGEKFKSYFEQLSSRGKALLWSCLCRVAPKIYGGRVSAMVELPSRGSRKGSQNSSKTQALARNRRRGLGLNATELLKNFAFELTPEFKQLVSKMDAMLAPLVDENNTISLDEAYAIVEGTGFKASASQNVNAELLDYFNDNGIQLSYDENATVMTGYITLVASEELASKIASGEVTTAKLGDYDKAIVPSSLSLFETNILASRILLAFLLRFVVS